jgi:hypothetical protein
VNEMKILLLVASGLLIASGCGDSASDSVTADGGSATDCPSTSPTDKTACALPPGTRCNYGCEAGGPSIATCTGAAWSVAQLEIACEAPDTGAVTVGDAATGCRADGDCPAMEYCSSNQPGGIVYCSTKVNDVACTVDDDCSDAGTTSICENYLCPSGTGRSCFPGCTDAQCGPTDQTGLVCAASGRCQAKSCQGAPDCPTNFDCNAGYCQRRTCTSDATCQGYCVTGKCGSALGTCERPRG